jgi:hypothetical protein
MSATEHDSPARSAAPSTATDTAAAPRRAQWRKLLADRRLFD